MKKIILFTVLIMFGYCAMAQQKEAGNTKIAINKNIELLGLAYFIGFEGVDIEEKTMTIEGVTMPKKDWHNYGYQVYQQYRDYATNVHLARCFALADHLWLDQLISLLLQVDDVPHAKLTDAVNLSCYIHFSKEKDGNEARKKAEIFLESMNLFAMDIDFESYLQHAKQYYDKMIVEVTSGLPDVSFIEVMEDFYAQKFDTYLWIPSLTISKGMGFGIKNNIFDKTIICNVFGSLDFQKFNPKADMTMGFDNSKKLSALSIHEFGHAFVNPVVAQLPDEIFKKTEKCFEPIRTAMYDQGYNTWKACVYEHFVRAGEIIIAEKMGDDKQANALLYEHLEKRKFIYIPTLLKVLRKYDEGGYASYYDAIKYAMEALVEK